PIVSDEEFEGYDLKNNEVYVTGTLAILDFFTNMVEGTAVTFVNDDSYEKNLEITKVYTEGILPSRLTFGMPVLIVDDQIYQEIKENEAYEKEHDMPTELIAFNIVNGDNDEILKIMDKKKNTNFTSKLKS